ncbi:MAG TPA: hypothetical protein VFZ27_07785 [Terriglobia bacterium]|nr:hypothetical protein [Terriglobia bacterium]
MLRVPGAVWFAVGGCLLAAFWMQQHDARIRQQAGLEQLRNETSAEASALRRQAAEDVRQANAQNAQAVAKLEQRRQQLEQQNRQLAAQLESLRKQAQIQAGEADTLPISEIVTRVAAQLGLTAEDVAAGEKALARKGAKARRKLRITNYELPEGGEETPHPAAGASTLSPGRGPGQASAADIAKSAILQGGATGENTPHPAAGASTLSPGRGLGTGDSADMAKSATSAPPNEAAALALSASGARKVEASLVALDSCRAQSGIQTRQLSNCQARAEADEAALERLKGSVAGLNQAVAAKDKILREQQREYKAELRAARGTFLGRLARLSEHVAIGVGVGVAIGVAVK